MFYYWNVLNFIVINKWHITKNVKTFKIVDKMIIYMEKLWGYDTLKDFRKRHSGLQKKTRSILLTSMIDNKF